MSISEPLRLLNIYTVDHTLIWTPAVGSVTGEEAKGISNHIKQMIATEAIDTVLVDNRAIRGSWAPEIDYIWIDLMRFMPIHIKKAATLCQDVVGKLQINYLSSQAGTTETVRAFTVTELMEMKQFLGTSTLPLTLD